MNITGYTAQGQAYYTDPKTRVTSYLGSQYDRAPTSAQPPASGGLLTSPGMPSGEAPLPASTAKAPALQQLGTTFIPQAGQSFGYSAMLNAGIDPTAYAATLNDPGRTGVTQNDNMDPASLAAYNKAIDPYYQVTAAPAARTGANVAQGTIYDQLQKQAKDGGYSWTSQMGNFNAYDAAGLLSNQGISSLDQLGYGPGGELINKTTGKALTTREKDQLGMSAQGTGRVDYDIRKDASGNPTIVPKWKSSTTDLGVAGKLIPLAASFIPGFGPIAAAALAAGTSIAQGGEAWDALKAAGMTYAGHELGSWAGDKIGQYAADNGISIPGFGGSTGTTGTDYSLGSGKLGDAFTTGNNGLGTGLLGNSTGTAGGTGAGLSVNPSIWNFGNYTSGIGANTYNPTDYSLTNGTTPINNNGSGLSTGTTNGGTGSGLSVSPGTGVNLAQPNGSGGILGNTGSSPFSVGGTAQDLLGKVTSLPMSDTARLAAAAIGAISGGAGASGSSSGGYKDDGYRPTIDRTGWSPTATPTLGGPSGIGLINVPKRGQANDGLWRYGLLG
ncbi:MAG: hypothetical protein Q7T97_02515 [Burkholderiaceae bacterium]|nr:hypothetical protein [Burkholderiaceae bacterium]